MIWLSSLILFLLVLVLFNYWGYWILKSVHGGG